MISVIPMIKLLLKLTTCLVSLQSRAAAMRNEIADFSGNLSLKRSTLPELQKEIGTFLKPQIQTLREDLHKVEESWLSFEEKQTKQRRQTRSSLESATDEFVEKLASLEDEENSLRENLQNRKTTMESEFNVSDLCRDGFFDSLFCLTLSPVYSA